MNATALFLMIISQQDKWSKKGSGKENKIEAYILLNGVYYFL